MKIKDALEMLRLLEEECPNDSDTATTIDTPENMGFNSRPSRSISRQSFWSSVGKIVMVTKI